MAKVDPKVMQSIVKLQNLLLTDEMKKDKRAREATENLIRGIKRRHGIKD